jgi:CRP-like cAMP-binding protein
MRQRSTAFAGGRKRAPPSHNGILASLPAVEYEALTPELEWVHVANGLYLDQVGGPVEHAYFPTQGIVSILYTGEAGESSELTVVGHEGMVSVTSFMAGHAALCNRALVRAPCLAYRLPAHRLKAKFAEGGVLQRVLLAYAQAVMLNISLTAVCNRHHTLEKQLCRWLLQSLDRMAARQLPVTQELIAQLLGVRRQGVTEAVRRLERLGVIALARGMITVKNYGALLANACECYSVVRRETARFIPPALAPRNEVLLRAMPTIQAADAQLRLPAPRVRQR